MVLIPENRYPVCTGIYFIIKHCSSNFQVAPIYNQYLRGVCDLIVSKFTQSCISSIFNHKSIRFDCWFFFLPVMPLPYTAYTLCIIHLLIIDCNRIGIRSLLDYRKLVKISNFKTVGREYRTQYVAVYHSTHFKHVETKQLKHERRLFITFIPTCCIYLCVNGIYANNL